MITSVDRTILWLTWRQLFARRRATLLVAFALAPALIALIFRLITADIDAEAGDFLNSLLSQIVIGIVLPVTAVIFGTGAFGGETDDGTLVYLLVKPVQRWRVVAVKYISATLCTAAITVPAIILPWVIVRTPEIPARVPMAFLIGALGGCAAYCAIFIALGITTRRALVAGLIYIVGIETVLANQIVGVKSLSVREFALTIVQSTAGGTVTSQDPHVTMATVWIMGSAILVGSLALAIRKLQRYELSERL